MTELNGVSGRRHFSTDEELALRQDESTNSIVKRDTKSTVDIDGTDLPWLETKHHQQGIEHQATPLVVEGLTTGFEAAEISGAVGHFEHLLAATRAAGAVEGGVAVLGAAAPLVALAAGTYALLEAHANGEEQARALAKDGSHVALIATLDLPASYKTARFDADYKHVPRDFQSAAFRATEDLKRDPKGCATLQLHADRGMNAARDLCRSGTTATEFVKAHPEVVRSIARDAAFREGFHAFLYAKATMPAADMKTFERQLDERDGWYAQSNISVRG